MKKKFIREQLKECLNKANKLITKDGTACFRPPFRSSECPSWTVETADYIRDERVSIYVRTWIIPYIEQAIEELSK